MDTTTIERTSTDQVYDTYVERLPASERDRVLGDWNPVREVVTQLVNERRAVQASRDLSDAGRQKALREIHERATLLAQKFPVDAGLARITDELEALEARALKGLVRTGTVGWKEAEPEPITVESMIRDREIRDQLRTMKASEVGLLYLDAIRKGEDPELIRAIERAPKAFPVITASIATQARQLRLEMSPLAPRLQLLGELRMAYSHFRFRARTDLGLSE